MSKFPCSLTRNMTSHSMENLTFHSLLRLKVIILQILATSLIQSLFERLGEYTFESQVHCISMAGAKLVFNCVLMRKMDAVKEIIADVLCVSPSSEQMTEG